MKSNDVFSLRTSDDYGKKGYGFAAASDEIDSLAVFQGYPLEDPNWFEPVFVLEDGKYADFLENDCSWPLCSDKLKKCIDRNIRNKAHVRWYPVKVKCKTQTVQYHALLIAGFERISDIVDINNSRCLADGEVYLPAFYYDKVKNLDIFSLEDRSITVFTSEELKNILEEAGISGLGFQDYYTS